MEFGIGLQELKRALRNINRIVNQGDEATTGMVMLSAFVDGTFEITGTDGEGVLETRALVNVETIKSGRALVRLRDIYKPITKLTGKKWIKVGLDNRTLIFNIEGLEIKTLTFTYETYPFPHPYVNGHGYEILESDLRGSIDRVFHCVNPNEVRRALRGFHLVLNGRGGYSLAGANGVKLYEANGNHNPTAYYPVPYNGIVPHHTIKVLKGLLKPKGINTIGIKINEKQVVFFSDDFRLVSNLILNEAYPDYGSMFELDGAADIEVDIDSVRELLGVIADTADGCDNYRTTLKSGRGELRINHDLTKCKVAGRTQGEIDVDLNSQYLYSMVKDMSGEVRINQGIDKNYITMDQINRPDDRVLLSIVSRR